MAALTAFWPAPGLAQLTEASLSNGRLTVRATDVELVEVARELAASGILEVTGQHHLSGRFTASIENAPVPEALAVLLAEFDYVVAARPATPPSDVVHRVRILRRRNGAPVRHHGRALRIAALDAARFAEYEHRGPDADDQAGAEADLAAEESDLRDKEATGAFQSGVSDESLAQDSDDVNPLIRIRVLETFVSRGTRPALPHLIKALGDEDPRVADFAVEQLGSLEDSVSMRSLGDAIAAAGDPSIRLRALRVFALRADRASVPYAEKLLRDDDETVRQAALQLIGALTRPGALIR